MKGNIGVNSSTVNANLSGICAHWVRYLVEGYENAFWKSTIWEYCGLMHPAQKIELGLRVTGTEIVCLNRISDRISRPHHMQTPCVGRIRKWKLINIYVSQNYIFFVRYDLTAAKRQTDGEGKENNDERRTGLSELLSQLRAPRCGTKG